MAFWQCDGEERAMPFDMYNSIEFWITQRRLRNIVTGEVRSVPSRIGELDWIECDNAAAGA
jgi:hypothetical protein